MIKAARAELLLFAHNNAHIPFEEERNVKYVIM